jgi:hypothetical protein
LPNIFLVREHVVRKPDIDALSQACSRGLQTQGWKSSWVNAEFMLDVITTLMCCLGEEMKPNPMVPDLDAHRNHTPVCALEACSSAGTFVHITPALMTSWQQALNVSVFSPFMDWDVREG